VLFAPVRAFRGIALEVCEKDLVLGRRTLHELTAQQRVEVRRLQVRRTHAAEIAYA